MDETQGAIDQAAAAAKARFEAMARKALERGERDRELAARVQAMTATVSSRRKEVTVTVDHGGACDRYADLGSRGRTVGAGAVARGAGDDQAGRAGGGEVGWGGCPRVLGGREPRNRPDSFLV